MEFPHIAIGVALFSSGYFVIAVELFPTAVRCSRHGLSFNLSVALFGGSTPLIAAALVDRLNTPIAPGVLFDGAHLTLGLLGVAITSETKASIFVLR